MKSYCAYIMASHRRVLYIGFTGRLETRVSQHKRDAFPQSFTSRYRCHNLVYWEAFEEPIPAINREKELKRMRRAEKIVLIEKQNPKWKDLAAGWGRKFRASDLKALTGAGQLRAAVPTDPSSRKGRAPQDDSQERGNFSTDSSAGSSPPQNDIGFRTSNGSPEPFVVQRRRNYILIRLTSSDDTNRLMLATVLTLTCEIEGLAQEENLKPIIITGNSRFFSVGADLNEIIKVTAPEALEFAKAGQRLMRTIAEYPSPVFAAIEGYCMGGGLDLALACHRRICSPSAIFGHRGAALGLMTGWGGTQRLPRLIGKGRAMQMFLAAEKIDAQHALDAGLVEAICDDPVSHLIKRLS